MGKDFLTPTLFFMRKKSGLKTSVFFSFLFTSTWCTYMWICKGNKKSRIVRPSEHVGMLLAVSYYTPSLSPFLLSLNKLLFRRQMVWISGMCCVVKGMIKIKQLLTYWRQFPISYSLLTYNFKEVHATKTMK